MPDFSRPFRESRSLALLLRSDVANVYENSLDEHLFSHHSQTRSSVGKPASITTGGRLAHLLKDAIEWEYRQSVRHLRGWDLVAR
jgi:hypothetical protein